MAALVFHSSSQPTAHFNLTCYKSTPHSFDMSATTLYHTPRSDSIILSPTPLRISPFSFGEGWDNLLDKMPESLPSTSSDRTMDSPWSTTSNASESPRTDPEEVDPEVSIKNEEAQQGSSSFYSHEKVNLDVRVPCISVFQAC